jgi:hypothetical protein
MAELEADHAKPKPDHVVEPKSALVGQKKKESDNKEERGAKPSTVTPIVNDPLRSFTPIALYPERLKAPKKNAQFPEILEVFKQVQINIPFLDAIQQVPSYAKFMKDLVTIKRKTNVSNPTHESKTGISNDMQCSNSLNKPMTCNSQLRCKS